MFSLDSFFDFNQELKVHGLNYALFSLRMLENQESSPTEWSSLLQAFRHSAVNELFDADQVKLDYDEKDSSDLELKYPALSPYYLSVLSSDAKLVQTIRKYLLENMAQLFEEKLQETVVDGLKLALNVSFDRFICYENLLPASKLKYALDLEAWSNAGYKQSIVNYRTKDEHVYELSIDSTIEKQFEEYLSLGLKLNEAVYKLRMGLIGFLGQKVFTYKRKKVLI